MGNFLSVLKAIGKGILWVSGVVLPTLPQIAPVAAVISLLSKITAIVGMAESAAESWGSAVTGQQKLEFAVKSAIGAIRASELVAGREIADEVKFERGATSLVSGVADILDSLKHKS